MSEITAVEALTIVRARAQWCREEGESDMRSIIWMVDSLLTKIAEGKSAEEIKAYLSDDEE